MTYKNESHALNKEVKRVVLARIDAQFPSNYRLAIGSFGTFSKQEIMEHINKEDEVGKQIVASHLLFLKALINGQFTKAIASV